MDFEYSPKVKDLQQRVSAFMEEHVYPNEARFHEEITANRNAGNAWVPTKVVEELKAQAEAAGLWNLWLPESEYGAGLTNLEYAPSARSWAARTSARRRSTAPRPTPATWRCWCATATRRRRHSGLRGCSRASTGDGPSARGNTHCTSYDDRATHRSVKKHGTIVCARVNPSRTRHRNTAESDRRTRAAARAEGRAHRGTEGRSDQASPLALRSFRRDARSACGAGVAALGRRSHFRRTDRAVVRHSSDPAPDVGRCTATDAAQPSPGARAARRTPPRDPYACPEQLGSPQERDFLAR
jgi:hypothetical protein